MLSRHAAALLCGAAAVHLADLLFHAGLIFGLSDEGQGRTMIIALGIVPLFLFGWAACQKGVPAWEALLGACAGYVIDEWILVPGIGWTLSTLVWLAPWTVARILAGRSHRADDATPGKAALLGALALGCAAGFAFAAMRPFLFQHVAGTRHGLRLAVTTGLLGLLSGAALGRALQKGVPRLAQAALAAVFTGVAFLTSFMLVPKAAANGFSIPFVTGAWAATWWGRSLVASWSMLGLMSVAFGLALPLIARRLAILFVLAGLLLGTWLGELTLASLGKDPVAFRVLADKAARHPALEPIEAAAINADGIWTRYKTRTLLEVESVGFWQATRMDRGELWHNLEGTEARDGATVLRSRGYLASGLALRDTVQELRRRERAAPGGLRCCADPRALGPAGLMSLLATWQKAFPDGRFSVLVDGYSGPLLSVETGAAAAGSAARELVLFESPMRSAFKATPGTPSTWDRPVLEWETAVEPSPFPHPTGEVMQALEDVLAIEPGSAAAAVLKGLVAHAKAQIARTYVVSSWDHVVVDDVEIESYTGALRKDDRSPILLRHLQIVFDVLLKKREYAILVRNLEESVARIPDSFAFHHTLGKAYADILKWPDAIEELTLARDLRPEDREVPIELSRALGGGRRWKEAVSVLEAERARNEDPSVRKGLAIALMESGDFAAAQTLLGELRVKYPADLDIMKAADRIEQLKAASREK